MKTLLELLAPKLLSSVLVLALLCAGVWIGGPYLAFAGKMPFAAVSNRLIVILVLTLAWCVKNLQSAVQAKQDAVEINDANESLTKHFKSALSFIQKTQLKQQLAAFPQWQRT